MLALIPGTTGADDAIRSTQGAGTTQLVDATWAFPGGSGDAELTPYLLGTNASVDCKAIKAAPLSERLDVAAKEFGKAGLNDPDMLDVYDRLGLFSAPWVWWMLCSFGYQPNLVQGWTEDLVDTPRLNSPRTFNVRHKADLNATKRDVLEALSSDVQIVDARSAARFAGTAPEPRAGSRSGHMPGAKNVPFPSLKDPAQTYAFKGKADLLALFYDAGIDLAKPIITTCGSGVTASGLAFCLLTAGVTDIRVYQGSWAEWGQDDSLPVEVSA